MDAPETVHYIKSQGVAVNRNYDGEGRHVTMWGLIVRHLTPPTRLIRYCCRELKEANGKGRVKATGVRWAESPSRREHSGLVQIIGKPKTTQRLADEMGADYKTTRQGGMVLNDDNDASRRMVEHCYRTETTMVNPIVDWSDEDVWEFLRHYGCEGNPLYKCGFSRIGCIGCPMARKRAVLAQFERWPKYRDAYVAAFDRMLAARREKGYRVDERWKDGEAVMQWWING